jgi:tetratricopeptide (TPR) repeat protein
MLQYTQDDDNLPFAPDSFDISYELSTLQPRFYLENFLFSELVNDNTVLMPTKFPWDSFPWCYIPWYFAKSYAASRIGNTAVSTFYLNALKNVTNTVLSNTNINIPQDWPGRFNNYIQIADAWNKFSLKNFEEADQIMLKVLNNGIDNYLLQPNAELYAQMKYLNYDYPNALKYYSISLKNYPNRYLTLYGMAKTYDKLGDYLNANFYFALFSNLCDPREYLPCLNCTTPILYNCREALELADAANYMVNRYAPFYIIVLFMTLVLFLFFAFLLLGFSYYVKIKYLKFKAKISEGLEEDKD